MISWIVILGIVAVIAASSGAYWQRGSGGSFWLILMGIILLLPGLCGSFFLFAGMSDPGTSAEARSYMVLFTSVAVPSIQLSCLLMWLLARNTDVVWFRNATRWLGWFGAATAVTLFFNYLRMAFSTGGTFTDRAMIAGMGLLIAGVPFLIGGLPAMRLKPEPERVR